MNIQILGVGHSGTTIITRMLQSLGWNAEHIDGHYENVKIRSLNIDYIKTGKFDAAKALALLQELNEPWVIKDPRFVKTQSEWNSVYLGLKELPTVIHITRHATSIFQSHQRRSEKVDLPTIYRLQQESTAEFQRYPGHKVEVSFENLANAMKVFNIKRASKNN